HRLWNTRSPQRGPRRASATGCPARGRQSHRLIKRIPYHWCNLRRASSAARTPVSAHHNVDRARIFVSFAGEDRARAMELVRWLNDGGWHVVADDRHSFAVPEGSISSARLDHCDIVLCVVTPRWLESDSCRREFSYCAKRGKFILPVICELADLTMLPPAVRARPRVDLRQNRLTDYLALKESLTQTGSQIAPPAAAHSGGPPRLALTRAPPPRPPP